MHLPSALHCISNVVCTEGTVAVVAVSEGQQPEVASWLPEASQDLPLHVLRDAPALLQVCSGTCCVCSVARH